MVLQNKDILNISGMTCNLVGSLILALSLNKVISMINNSFKALEIAQTSNIVISGMNKHRSYSMAKSNKYVVIGIILIIIGFILQISTYFNN